MTAEAIRPAGGRIRARGVSKLAAAKRAGLPAGVASAAVMLAAVLISVVVLATGGRGQALMTSAQAAARSDLATLGFRIGEIHLQGASPAAQNEILAAAALRPGAPILDVDLVGVRDRVERVGWVAHAKVIRLLPDTLVIAVTQRPLLAVWEHAGRTVVVADNGAVVNQVDPAHFSALPLIVGEGANLDAAKLVPLINARPRLAEHVDAVVRVDGRRWNLRLKDGGLVMLPATEEAAALKRLDALDRSAKVLDLGLARLDLRDPEMVVARPRQAAGPVLAGGGA
ncbi:MAG TPA: cell division protein FtsQ/DivIB [Caulobacteraceae bacterium]|nr:cell division protein FtsQ/DivIB [Caulobacteraceae bacterium]